MIQFTLTSPVDSARIKLEGGKLIVAEDQTFTIGLATEGANSPNTFTVTYSDAGALPGSAAISGTNFTGYFPEVLKNKTLLFEAQNGELGELKLTVVPKYYIKRISAHVYNVYNYTSGVLAVRIEDSEAVEVYSFSLGAEEFKQITLPDDGYYKVRFTSGLEVTYSAIIDTSMIDKFMTDLYRSLFCKCGTASSKEKFLAWTQLTALRSHYMMLIDPSLLLGKYYSAASYEPIANEFVKAHEVLQTTKKLVKDLIDLKCLQGCSCGC